MIETLANVLDFLDISNQYFIVDASNDGLILKYDSGTATTVDIPDGTYDASSLATAIQTAMNTALTMSGTVTWSSTTNKFSFGAGAGHTLTYTHTGSDAGLLVGFNQDHSAALTLTSDVEVGDPTSIVSSIHTGVEAWIKRECRRAIESASFTEIYDGTGTDILFLKQYPITAITRVAVGRRNVISIYNSATYSTATVSVTSTGVVLTKDGVSDSTCTFASYTTMTTLTAAINAISGWTASVLGDYGNFASSELKPVYGLNCIENTMAYLHISDLALSDFEVYAEEGYIYNLALWTKGHQNISVDYTAGYSSSNMPEELKMAVKILVKLIYQQRQEESFGLTSFSLAGISETLDTIGIPVQAKRIIDSYRAVLV